MIDIDNLFGDWENPYEMGREAFRQGIAIGDVIFDNFEDYDEFLSGYLDEQIRSNSGKGGETE